MNSLIYYGGGGRGSSQAFYLQKHQPDWNQSTHRKGSHAYSSVCLNIFLISINAETEVTLLWRSEVMWSTPSRNKWAFFNVLSNLGHVFVFFFLLLRNTFMDQFLLLWWFLSESWSLLSPSSSGWVPVVFLESVVWRLHAFTSLCHARRILSLSADFWSQLQKCLKSCRWLCFWSVLWGLWM